MKENADVLSGEGANDMLPLPNLVRACPVHPPAAYAYALYP